MFKKCVFNPRLSNGHTATPITGWCFGALVVHRMVGSRASNGPYSVSVFHSGVLLVNGFLTLSDAKDAARRLDPMAPFKEVNHASEIMGNDAFAEATRLVLAIQRNGMKLEGL